MFDNFIRGAADFIAYKLRELRSMNDVKKRNEKKFPTNIEHRTMNIILFKQNLGKKAKKVKNFILIVYAEASCCHTETTSVLMNANTLRYPFKDHQKFTNQFGLRTLIAFELLVKFHLPFSRFPHTKYVFVKYRQPHVEPYAVRM